MGPGGAAPGGAGGGAANEAWGWAKASPGGGLRSFSSRAESRGWVRAPADAGAQAETGASEAPPVPGPPPGPARPPGLVCAKGLGIACELHNAVGDVAPQALLATPPGL